MSADCFACKINIPTITEENAVGNKGNPVGCCILCHSLICGYHGRREPNDAEFICVICIPLVAAGVAVTQVDQETQILQELRNLFRKHNEIFPSELLREDPVAFFEEWKPSRRTFSKAKSMYPVIKHDADISADLRKTILALVESVRACKLLAIARLAIDWYEIRTRNIPHRLAQILDVIEWEGYNAR